MQIVENWAEPPAVADVAGFPNLITATVGDVVRVIARRDALQRAGVVEGSHVRGRVRKGLPSRSSPTPTALSTELMEAYG